MKKILAVLAALLMVAVLAAPGVMAGKDVADVPNIQPLVESITVTDPIMSLTAPSATVVVVVKDENGRDDLNAITLCVMEDVNNALEVDTGATSSIVYEDLVADSCSLIDDASSPDGYDLLRKEYIFTIDFKHWTPPETYDVKIDASDRFGDSSSKFSTEDTTDGYDQLTIEPLSAASVADLDFGIINPLTQKTMPTSATNRGNQQLVDCDVVCNSMNMDSGSTDGDDIPASAFTATPEKLTLEFGYPTATDVTKDISVKLDVPAVRSGLYHGTIELDV